VDPLTSSSFSGTASVMYCSFASKPGLTLAKFTAQLEDLRDMSLKLELNLSTFGTHPRVNLGYVWVKVSFS
jgi:hypothetical protein